MCEGSLLWYSLDVVINKPLMSLCWVCSEPHEVKAGCQERNHPSCNKSRYHWAPWRYWLEGAHPDFVSVSLSLYRFQETIRSIHQTSMTWSMTWLIVISEVMRYYYAMTATDRIRASWHSLTIWVAMMVCQHPLIVWDVYISTSFVGSYRVTPKESDCSDKERHPRTHMGYW